MRLSKDSSGEFLGMLGKKIQDMEDAFLKLMKNATHTVPVKVMLGDSTVTEQNTFDPSLVNTALQGVLTGLKGWTMQGVSSTNNEDIRRIFLKFEKMVGNYLISCHMSVQFHVLLYYRPDQRVIQCQKELSGIVDTTKDAEQQISDTSDQFILYKLKEMGCTDLGHQALFETLYKNDELREKISKEIENTTDTDFQSLQEKKNKLLAELDSLLLETYQVSQVLIDDSRLVTGEEGFLFTIDMEHVKNNTKHGTFDYKKISNDTRVNIAKNLDDLLAVLNSN